MQMALYIGYKKLSLLQCTLDYMPIGGAVGRCIVEQGQYIADDLKATVLSNSHMWATMIFFHT